jgi:HSP20 family protein
MAGNSAVAVKTPEQRFRHWDPIAFLDELREDLERRFDSIFPARRPLQQGPFSTIPWAPRMDVFEKDGTLVVTAELPGMQKADIEVTVEDGDLVIQGERKSESETKEDSYYRMERAYGSFYRRLTLPASTTAESSNAAYQDGVLEVRVPLSAPPEKQATKVPVS